MGACMGQQGTVIPQQLLVHSRCQLVELLHRRSSLGLNFPVDAGLVLLMRDGAVWQCASVVGSLLGQQPTAARPQRRGRA